MYSQLWNVNRNLQAMSRRKTCQNRGFFWPIFSPKVLLSVQVWGNNKYINLTFDLKLYVYKAEFSERSVNPFCSLREGCTSQQFSERFFFITPKSFAGFWWNFWFATYTVVCDCRSDVLLMYVLTLYHISVLRIRKRCQFPAPQAT